MKSTPIFWLLFFSLSLPSSLSQAVGVNVPTFATLFVKTAGIIAAHGAMDCLDSIRESKLAKNFAKVDLPRNQIINSTAASCATEFTDSKPSMVALVGTGILFFTIIAWAVKNSDQSLANGTADKQKNEASKA